MAGLSPENIAAALQFKMAGEAADQKKVTDLVDIIYKSALTEQALATAGKQRQTNPIFVKGAPGYGNLTLDQYKALPTEDRQYITHVMSARQRGEEPLSRKEFDAIGDKDKHPATAEAAAIDQLYKEYRGSPPQSKIKEIQDLYNPVKKPEPKTPSPVTWTTATQELTKRFGKLDPTGMWAVTPELQATHTRAQEILTDLKDQGIGPLRAVNQAADRAKKEFSKVEAKYFQLLDLADGDRDKIDKVKSQFYNTYKYIPVERTY